VPGAPKPTVLVGHRFVVLKMSPPLQSVGRQAPYGLDGLASAKHAVPTPQTAVFVALQTRRHTRPGVVATLIAEQ
jgi:hypothetical protein